MLRAETWLTVYRTIANTDTVAKRARVGPRTQMHITVKKLFLIRIASTRRRGSPIIVLDNALKIWTELITQRNDNALEKFYWVWWFGKFGIFG